VPDVSSDVVVKIDHSDLHRRPGDADGSYEEPNPGFLVREDVLNARLDI
jgi:hypothetical protein